MQIRRIHIPNSRLEQGSILPFTILKVMNIDSESFFVLQDPGGYKLLMPYDRYAHYGLVEGQTISCRIDKVNCNGRVFLEPAHPYYKEGKAYTFQVIGSGQRTNLAGEKLGFLLVRDKTGKTWEVVRHHASNDEPEMKEVRCRVVRIKKGVLYLELDGDRTGSATLEAGKTYSFYVSGEGVDPLNNQAYFVLKDENGNGHLLRKKHFLHYGIKPGMQIRCRTGFSRAAGQAVLEPEHPCYLTGEVYEWKTDHLEELVFSDGSKQMVLVLKDCFGEEVKLHLDGETAKKHHSKGRVWCRVKEIVKSRPDLELLSEYHPI